MVQNDFDELYGDEEITPEAWAAKLVNTHYQRALIQKQTHRFYFRRRIVEYGVKASIMASMAIAFIWGGPPFWIVGGAALMLSIATLVLNRFNPKQFIDGTVYQAKSQSHPFAPKKTLEKFRQCWLEERSKYLFAKHESNLYHLQKRIAGTLVLGFIIFTILNASLSLSLIIAGLGCAASLIREADEIPPPYVEEEKQLSRLFVSPH